jgi:hypothetical protein
MINKKDCDKRKKDIIISIDKKLEEINVLLKDSFHEGLIVDIEHSFSGATSFAVDDPQAPGFDLHLPIYISEYSAKYKEIKRGLGGFSIEKLSEPLSK